MMVWVFLFLLLGLVACLALVRLMRAGAAYDRAVDLSYHHHPED